MSWLRKRKRASIGVDLSHLCQYLTGGSIVASRDGNVVNVAFNRVQLSEAANGNLFLLTLPVGYRPQAEQVTQAVRYSSTDSVRSFQFSTTGSVGITTKSDSGTQLRASISYITSDPEVQ